jgi:NtrC-family two-component system sensor histidine kinase KinB
MRLKNKILTSNGLVLVLSGMVIVWALVNIISLGQASDAILRENYRSISAAIGMRQSMDQQKTILLQVRYEEPDQPLHENLRKLDALFIEWLARAKDNITISGEAEIVEKISDRYSAYREEVALWLSVDKDTSPLPRQGEIRSLCTDLLELNESIMYEASNQARVLSNRAFISTLVITAISLLFVFFFSLLLAERIVKPIYKISEASRRLSQGDYSAKVDVGSKDELGTLAEEFNAMALQLGNYHELNIEQIVSEKNKADTIISGIEDGLVVFDKELVVISINPAALKIFNADPLNTLGSDCEDLCGSVPLCSIIRESVHQDPLNGLPEEERILVIQNPNGEPRHYQYTLSPILGKRKIGSGILVLLRNITRMKELEDLKSEFVMAASHELKTPLTSLGMSIDLLYERLMNSEDEMERDLISTAREEIFYMKSLTEDLLELSRLESGRIEIDQERVEVNSLFEYIESIFRKQAEEKQIKLSRTVHQGAEFLDGDMNKVTWVLSNLVSNALRYISDKGMIKISAAKIGFNIHISVEDDGQGIPPCSRIPISNFSKILSDSGPEIRWLRIGIGHL